MKKTTHRIPQVLIRLDGVEYLTTMYADEGKVARLMGTVRQSIKSIDPVVAALLIVFIGVLNLIWIGYYFAQWGIELSLGWQLVLAMVTGPLVLVLLGGIIESREVGLAIKKRSQLLYRFPRPMSKHSAELMDRAYAVSSVAESVRMRSRTSPLDEAAREQIDVLTSQLSSLTDLLADNRGRAGHSQLAEDAAHLGDAVPANAAHLAVRHNEWLAGLQQWDDDYEAARKSLESSVEVLNFSIRLAQSEQSKK